MKILKAVSILATTIPLIMATSAFSADTLTLNDAEIINSTVTFRGAVPTAGARVFIELVRQGADIDTPDDIYLAKQVKASSTGEFSVSCVMPEFDRIDSTRSIDGYYTAYAFCAGLQSVEYNFAYIAPSSRTNFFNQLNSACKDVSGLKAFIQDDSHELMWNTYGIDVFTYNNYAYDIQEKACECIIDANITYNEQNISGLNEIISAMVLNTIETKDDAIAILNGEHFAKRPPIECEGVNFDNASVQVQDRFLSLVVERATSNDFSSFDEVYSLYNNCYVLGAITSTHYSDLFMLLDKFSTTIGIDSLESFRKISKLSTTDKQNVMRTMLASVKEIPDVDTLSRALSNAYDKYLADKNKSSGSSSGGSSGGGGGGAPSKSGQNSIIAGTAQKETDTVEEMPIVTFPDLDGYDWAKDAITTLATAGVISGYENGNFNPGSSITRAEFIKLLINATALTDTTANSSFDDVPTDDWSYPYISTAYAQGITSGKSKTQFGKDDPITREEAIVFLHRCAVRTYLPLTDGDLTFTDVDLISSWAARSVRIMVASGYIHGNADNTFNPQASTTRAEATVMINSLYKALK